MPNHVTNIITYAGDRKQITEMLEAIKKDELGIGTVDFNKIVPMPDDIYRGDLGPKERELYGNEDRSCEVIEACSDMISSETQPAAITAENMPQDAVFSMETTMSISESGMDTTETEASETKINAEITESKTTTVTTTASKPEVTTTTAKQTTAARTTTTTVTTTVTEPPTPQSVVDLNQVSDQMWVFLTEYGIAYDELYAAGAGLRHDGTDYGKAKAVCEYAYNLGGRNCIEYALHAYFLAKGAGLECNVARSSLYDWYGHVGNVIKLDCKWYYMEPMSNITGSPQTYAAGAAYPDGLDIVTDIYENRIQVTIRELNYSNSRCKILHTCDSVLKSLTYS